MYLYSKQLTLGPTYDVIVVGSGSAGAVAAIASARAGARTLLLERLPFLGGTSTAVLDTFYGFYTPGRQSLKVVGGIPDDVVRRLQTYGATLERPNTHGAGTGVTYHPEYLKVVWDELIAEAGVHVLVNAWVQDVAKSNRRIEGLIAATKTGLARFNTQVIVDASGDADICYFAGVPFELAGDHDPAQTLTTTFKLVNVDLARRMTVGKADFHQLMAQAADSGKYNLPRKEGSDHITPVDHMTATIMTRLPSSFRRDGHLINATDPYLLTEAETKGRRQALEYIRFLKDCVPGYEKAQLATFSTHIGVRETRRVYGAYRLTREDVLNARQFDDQIGLCGAPIEDHREGSGTAWSYLPEGKCVGVPFRTLLPQHAENLLVAGRCFSASHDAHASVRSMAQCMSMGQAVGIAAALSANRRTSPHDVNSEELRDKLRKAGAILELR